jgi:hypothetical protein
MAIAIVALHLCGDEQVDDHVVRYLAFTLLGMESADGLSYRRPRQA